MPAGDATRGAWQDRGVSPRGGEPAEARPLGRSVLLGATAGVVLSLMAAALLTMPLFALAWFTEPVHGTGRAWFSSGVRWAIVAGAVVGLAGGVGVARWLRRGGKLPEAPDVWEILDRR